MKPLKAFLLLVAMLTLSFNAKADRDQVISFNELPATAQSLLKENFANKVPLVITTDEDDYTIIYESGETVEFDKLGKWKEIKCKASFVPSVFIPQEIANHINATFPGTHVIKIERHYYGYEVKLNNHFEIEYNNQFQVMDIDR